MAKVRVWVEVLRGVGIETRGVEGSPEEVREQVAHYARQYGVHRVLDDLGQDVTAEWREEPDAGSESEGSE